MIFAKATTPRFSVTSEIAKSLSVNLSLTNFRSTKICSCRLMSLAFRYRVSSLNSAVVARLELLQIPACTFKVGKERDQVEGQRPGRRPYTYSSYLAFLHYDIRYSNNGKRLSYNPLCLEYIWNTTPFLYEWHWWRLRRSRPGTWLYSPTHPTWVSYPNSWRCVRALSYLVTVVLPGFRCRTSRITILFIILLQNLFLYKKV